MVISDGSRLERWRSNYALMRLDIATAMIKDPACTSVVFAATHQGLHAIWMHRISHYLHRNQHAFSARLVSYLSRVVTGVDVHPGADLQPGVFIDHASGVVIGETAVLEQDVMLYHNVTVGSVGWWQPKVIEGRRHPIIRQGAVLCTGSAILGPVEVGRNSIIGANAVVLADVPENTQVTPGVVWRGHRDEPFDTASVTTARQFSL